jgi:hypothetical protein
MATEHEVLLAETRATDAWVNGRRSVFTAYGYFSPGAAVALWLLALLFTSGIGVVALVAVFVIWLTDQGREYRDKTSSTGSVRQ